MVKNPLAHAGVMGSIPPGRFCMPQGARVTQLFSLSLLRSREAAAAKPTRHKLLKPQRLGGPVLCNKRSRCNEKPVH